MLGGRDSFYMYIQQQTGINLQDTKVWKRCRSVKCGTRRQHPGLQGNMDVHNGDITEGAFGSQRDGTVGGRYGGFTQQLVYWHFRTTITWQSLTIIYTNQAPFNE